MMTHIYVSKHWAIIGSNNGLSPIRHQAIIWTTANVVNWPIGKKKSMKFASNTIFYPENKFENVAHKTTSILS